MNDTTQFQDTIAGSREILVVLPKNPQFDTVAAGLSLYRSLQVFGKKTHIFCLTPMLVEFNRLVGVDQVGSKLGEKNLAITLRDYPAANIERVSYDIENREMKLTIIPKDGVSSPVKEQVAISPTGTSADTAVLVGVENQEQPEEVNRELANIPHSIYILGGSPQSGFERKRGGLEIAEARSSSLSETVGIVIANANLPLDQDIANNLFQGLASATNNFTTSSVRAETFELASRLVRARGDATQPKSDEPPHPAEEEEKTPQDWFKPKIYKGTQMP